MKPGQPLSELPVTHLVVALETGPNAGSKAQEIVDLLTLKGIGGVRSVGVRSVGIYTDMKDTDFVFKTAETR